MTLLNLLNKVLSSRFFEVLRTQQQLGYVVSMQVSPATNFDYLIAVIQTEFPSDYVRSRIDAFLDEYLKFVEEALTEEEFKTCLEGLMSEYKVQPKSLPEELGLYHRFFTNRTYAFDRRKKALALCETSIKLDTLRTFVRDVLRKAPRIYNQVKKILDKPDKPLPDNAEIPADVEGLRLWTTHEETVKAFAASATWFPVGKSA
eukprot:TRINITY_DN23304_c0_g1_i3.p1 TRINITY_DN23304_c0_g1~~TRINITY_DN23304_c0_g1_i3.p1  ORF type:complete len:203 (+),score=38.10 TRINITY_DN23304_c0_g1_i3:312-920(+)